MSYARREISVGFSEKPFLAGSHICLLYGDDAERTDVLARFFEAGRLENERLVYVHAGGTDADARAALAHYGFNGGSSLSTRGAHARYFPHGCFHPHRGLAPMGRLPHKAGA